MELFKLLDNNRILDVRADIPVDSSVDRFIDIIFRLGTKSDSQKAYHEDIFRLLQSTELYKFIEEFFPVVYLNSKTLIPDNYWVSLNSLISSNPTLITDFLFFYGGVFSSAKKRNDFEFLKSVYETHKNPVYVISSLIIIHILGSRILKENLC